MDGIFWASFFLIIKKLVAGLGRVMSYRIRINRRLENKFESFLVDLFLIHFRLYRSK